MKEYDIYIRNRIHEANVYIYSLTFRDGISVTNRLILEAMLNYYTLQKAVAVQHDTELAAEIDKIISLVREQIETSTEIQAKADLITLCKAEPEQSVLELDIDTFTAFAKSLFAVEDALQIGITNVDAIAKSSLGDTENSLAILTEEPDLEAIMYGAVDYQMNLEADIQTNKQSYESIQNTLGIETPELGLFFCHTTGLETAMSLAAEIASMETHYSLGDAASELAITVPDLDTTTTKNLTISDEISLFCEMADTAISYFQADDGLAISLAGEAGLKRYRLLSEMDDLTLEELDDMTLEELDYVTIE